MQNQAKKTCKNSIYKPFIFGPNLGLSELNMEHALQFFEYWYLKYAHPYRL